MIVVSNNHPFLRFSRRETFQTIQNVLRRESARALSLSVVFVGSRFIRRINRRFLNHDEVTDVIAFPFHDGMGVDGEVYVNLDRAKSQARAYRVSFGKEARRLLIHGTLHLVGYSDATAQGKARMREREDYFLMYMSSKGGRS